MFKEHPQKPKMPSVMRLGAMQFDVIETAEGFVKAGETGDKFVNVDVENKKIRINPNAPDIDKLQALIWSFLLFSIVDGRGREGMSLNEMLNMLDRPLTEILVDNPGFIEFIRDIAGAMAIKAKDQ